ncbi:SNF2 family helicase [Spironucleus salmonicida]|uniref:SNF2 family N-terminal domain containing protein n=1 Tax=Spironucleus salmonicida TaxID=348837 RepID=V6LMI7_9EUKA|nr:SNF2 family helicase [Spironucleus salmonicida]|eukprot:EST45850.1 SNF2 family N-terminal domain containing protein [Spironucleus salmonicida]
MKKRGRPSKKQVAESKANAQEQIQNNYQIVQIVVNDRFLTPTNYPLLIHATPQIKVLRAKLNPNTGFHQNTTPEDFQKIVQVSYQQNFNSFLQANILHRRKQILQEYEYKQAVFKLIATQLLPIQQKIQLQALKSHAIQRPEYPLLQEIKQIRQLLYNSGKRLKQLQNEEKQALHHQKMRKVKINFVLQQTQLMCTQITNQLSLLDKSPPKLLSQLEGTLRPYQINGFNFLLSCTLLGFNAILADDLGLGKSLQTIALLAKLCEYGIYGPHLIIVPSTLLYNWENEFKKWFPACNVLVYFGSKQDRDKLRQGWSYEKKFSVLITSYNIAVSDCQILKRRQFYFLIMDEAHLIRNSTSRAWNVLISFNSVQKLLISGTPISNSASDIWSLLHFVLPGFFASKVEFLKLFARDVERMADGELGVSQKLIRSIHSLLRPFMLRRLKSEVESELPAKREYIIPCPLSRRQLYLYSEYMQNGDQNNYLQVVNVLTQLRKICNHPILVEEQSAMSGFVFEGVYQQHNLGYLKITHHIYKWDSELIYKRSNGFWNNFGTFLPKSMRQTQFVTCSGCQKPEINKNDNKFAKMRACKVDLESLFQEVDDSAKKARKVLVAGLDFEFATQNSYQLNVLKAYKMMRNYVQKQHFCGSCVHSSQQDTNNVNMQKSQIPGLNQLFFEQEPFFGNISAFKTTRSAHLLKVLSSDAFLARGCAFSMSSNLAISYVFEAETLVKFRDFEDFKFLMSQEHSYSYDSNLERKTQQMQSDEMLKIQHRRSVIQALHRPFFDFQAFLAVFDARIVLQLSRFSQAMKRAFLGTEIFRDAACGLTSILELIQGLRADYAQFEILVENALLPLNRTVPSTPSPAGQWRSGNYLLNEIFTIQEQDRLKCEREFGIPFPNPVFYNHSKIQTLKWKFNLKLMRNNQIAHIQFYNNTRNNNVSQIVNSLLTPKADVIDQNNLQSKIPLPDQDEILQLDSFDIQTKLQYVKNQLKVTSSVDKQQYKKQQLFRIQKPPENSVNLGRVLLHLTVPELNYFSMVNAFIPQQTMFKQPYCILLVESGSQCSAIADYSFPNAPNSYSFNDHTFTFKKISPTELFTDQNLYLVAETACYADLDELQNIIYRPRVLTRANQKDQFIQKSSLNKFLQFPSPRDLITDSGKLTVLRQLLLKLHKQQSKCLIFTQQTKFLDILETFLSSLALSFYRMDGTTPPKQRQLLVDKFNAFPQIFAFIMTTRTGGIGLNLTGADSVIFVDTDWNPQVHQQATDRVHRINQVKEVSVYTLVSEFTVEENIVRRATQKKNLDKIILRNGAFVPQFFEENDEFRKQIDRRNEVKERQIQLVYTSLVSQKSAQNRLSDVLEAFCDDDDKEAKENLLNEQLGDFEIEKNDEVEVVETGKQLMEQVEIFTAIEQAPPCYLRFFEEGYDAEADVHIEKDERVEIFGFRQEKNVMLKDRDLKPFQHYDVDFAGFTDIKADLEKYAEEEMEKDVALISQDVKTVRHKTRKLEVVVRAKQTFLQ